MKARRKAKPYMDKYGLIGLTIFIAIPLPGTGIWTGAIAGHLLGARPSQITWASLLGGTLSLAITYTLLQLGLHII